MSINKARLFLFKIRYTQKYVHLSLPVKRDKCNRACHLLPHLDPIFLEAQYNTQILIYV
jgi:hypothetical protein